MNRWIFLGVAVGVLAASRSAAAGPEEHVRGVISAVAQDVVTVTTADGEARKLRLGEKTRVSFASKANLDAIAKDGYVGTTAVDAGDGTLRALEVHVFPEAMRGAGEGHRPWDLQPGSTMTNARVTGVGSGGEEAPSTMTNATVAGVAGAEGGKKLTLSYAGGEKTVMVPPGTPVVRLEPGQRAALAPGQHLFAAGTRQPDGTVLLDRVTVGKDGVVPPM